MGRARRRYDELWGQASPFLGASTQPPPNLDFVPHGSGYTTTLIGAPGPRTVRVNPTGRKQLASRDPERRQVVRRALLHEFARVYGPDDQTGNNWSGYANGFANRATHALAQKKGNAKPGRPGRPRRYARKNLPYYGQNPQTIAVKPPST